MTTIRPGVDLGKACERLKDMLQLTQTSIRTEKKTEANGIASPETYALNYGRLEGAITTFLATCTNQNKGGASGAK